MKKKIIIISIILLIILTSVYGIHIYNHRNDYRYDSNMYVFGSSFSIKGEKFYIFSETDKTVTGLAEHCLDIKEKKQGTNNTNIAFSKKFFWKNDEKEYPYTIKMNSEESNAMILVSDYAKSLNSNSRGTMLTLNQYNMIKEENPDSIWIDNENYWLRTAVSNIEVYAINNGGIKKELFSKVNTYCVKPVIEIDKKYLD